MQKIVTWRLLGAYVNIYGAWKAVTPYGFWRFLKNSLEFWYKILHIYSTFPLTIYDFWFN